MLCGAFYCALRWSYNAEVIFSETEIWSH